MVSKKEDYLLYDDETLESMKRYFRVKNEDELLRYVKTYGMRKHIDIFEENKKSS